MSDSDLANNNVTGDQPSNKFQPILVSYEVSKDVYTLTRLGAVNTDVANATDIETNGYDSYVTVTGANNTTVKTDGSIKTGTFTSSDNASISRLYYESTGVVFVKSKADAIGEDGDYKVVTGKTASGYDRTILRATAVANKSGNGYYAQAAFIDLGTDSTGGSSDNYAVVLKNVEKKTGTANGTVYVITAWNGTEQITVTTDDSAANSMSKGDIFTYTATGDTLSDIEYKSGKQADAFVASFDEGYTMSDIDLARTFDSDFWSKGKLPALNDIQITNKVATDASDSANKLTEDAVPNARVFVDSASDDQITVIVIDVQHDITAW